MTEALLAARRADVAERSGRVQAVLTEVAQHSEVPLTRGRGRPAGRGP
jgi:hypothetical protein